MSEGMVLADISLRSRSYNRNCRLVMNYFHYGPELAGLGDKFSPCIFCYYFKH